MIVAVTSWRGVGTTTTALLLALAAAARGGAPWLLEADPAGGVLAGRIPLPSTLVGGLERRAFPGSDRVSLADVAAEWHGVRLVSAPADPFRAHACHHPASPWIDEVRSLGDGAPVVIDVGRMRAGSPAAPLLDLADVVLLVTSPEVSAAVGASEWLAAAGRISAVDTVTTGTDLRVVVVDSPGGRAFGRSLLAAEMGDRLIGWLPWDAAFVESVHRSGRPAIRRRKAALANGVDSLLDAIESVCGREDDSAAATAHTATIAAAPAETPLLIPPSATPQGDSDSARSDS